MKTYLLTILFLLPTGVISAQEEPFKVLIQQGIELHDAGQYEAAIEKYNEALKIRPDSKLAYYEIAYSYASLHKYEESISYGHKAFASAEDRPDLDLMIYTILGSSYDDVGKPEEAIKLYDEGLSKGDNYLLFYNKGLTYHRMNKLAEALDCYKNALLLNISHPTSNLNVARIYLQTDDIVSPFFYYTNFLLLEPNTNRSQIAFQELFASGESNNITIPTNDQQMLHLTLSMAFKAAHSMEKDEKIPAISPYHKLLNVFQVVYSMKDKVNLEKLNDDICAGYYAPLFFAACEDGYMELLCRYLTYSLDEESSKWVEENGNKFDAFFIWLNAFGQQGVENIEVNE